MDQDLIVEQLQDQAEEPKGGVGDPGSMPPALAAAGVCLVLISVFVSAYFFCHSCLLIGTTPASGVQIKKTKLSGA